MKWRKIGLVFCPVNEQPWMVSHASNPVAEHLEESLFRIYFSTRDDQNRSSITSIVISIEEPHRVLERASKPLLRYGEVGLFDDSGVSLGCIVQYGQTKYMYYLGWNLCRTVPWRNSIGLAIYNDRSQEFQRVSRAPIMDRSEEDPFSLSYPFVLIEGGKFRMWYGSNLKWGTTQKDMYHIIKYAESLDGIRWKRNSIVCIDSKYDSECAFSRPCVIKENNVFKMWYSYRGGPRGETYRIGYAESADAITWDRKDEEVGLDVSESGWDSEMIEYPFVFDHKGKRYMLYNGNSYGKTGFGLAVLES